MTRFKPLGICLIVLAVAMVVPVTPQIGPGGGGRGGTTTSGSIDNPSWGICITVGCGSEVAVNYYSVVSASGWTLDGCSFNLAISPTVQNVILDVQTDAAVSIFSTTKLVQTVGQTLQTIQSTFSSSPLHLAQNVRFRPLITQNDSPAGAAQGGSVHCWGH